MTKTAAAPDRAMDVDNSQHALKLNGHQVRFDFPFNDRDPVPHAPKILLSILRRVADSSGGDTEFRDVNGTVVDLDTFPQDKATFDTMFNTTVSDQRQRHILLVLEIRSTKTFHILKQLVWPLLTAHKVFMTQHTLGLHQVDVRSLGWLSRTNPKTHNKERVKDDIYHHLASAIDKISDKRKKALFDIFPDSTHEDKFDVPDFQLVHRRIVGNGSDKFETEAFEVQVERKHSKVLKQVMESVFAETSGDETLFIPYSLKHEISGDEYCTLIQQQNSYLENHRNITIVGIGNQRMHEPVRYENNLLDFDQLLRSKPGVYRVDSTKRTPDLGKWNISTDKQNYPALTTWIDNNLTAFFSQVPAQATELMDEFPDPLRLSLTSKTTSTSASSSYAKKLQSSCISAQPSNSPSPRRPAWNRPPIAIKYHNNTSTNFPPLPSKKNSDETRSTTSLTHSPSIDELIAKAIAEAKYEWQAETKKFHDELLQENLDLKLSLTQMIDDSIATQVKTIMNATISEFATNEHLRQYFVTREELQDLMQGFVKEIFHVQAQQRPEGNPKRKSSKKK
jgi:hypothetical protein